MDKQHEIVAELGALNSPLAAMSRRMPYEVPEGYFSRLPQHILTVVSRESEAAGLLPEHRQLPFEVPEDYFSALPAQILAKIHSGEAANLPGREMPFTVPENYFDQLPDQLLAKVKAESSMQQKTIPLNSRNRMQGIRWAAAAVLLLCLSVFGYQLAQSPQAEINRALSAVPDQSIQEYVEQNIDEYDSDLLVEHLAGNNVSGAGIDDAAIIQYLDENGWQAEGLN